MQLSAWVGMSIYETFTALPTLEGDGSVTDSRREGLLVASYTGLLDVASGILHLC